MGQPIRQSMDTANWEAATDRIRLWESQGYISSLDRTAPLIKDACADFVAEKSVERLENSSLSKYKRLSKLVVAWCQEKGILTTKDLTLADLQEFRRSWVLAETTTRLRSVLLLTMVRFWQMHKWTVDGLAENFKLPPNVSEPTLPFEAGEIESMLEACGKIPARRITRWRAEALVLLMRYSGLRISDASMLHRSKIQGNRIILYQTKTKNIVSVLVPDMVTQALKTVEARNGYYFTSGSVSHASASGNARRWLNMVFQKAKIENGHPHRLRDTFAVEMLNAGVSIENVSMLLGHASVRTTEQAYAPWVRSRQERLDQSVLSAHATDTFLQTNHAYSTRGSLAVVR